MTGFLDLTGDWLINDGSRAYSARLEQRSSRLSGVYDENRGTIEGFVESNVARIRWDQPTSQRAGDSELIIATDGKSMSGVWSYDPRAYGSGQWTFARSGQPHDDDLERFYRQLIARLRGKNYQRVEAPNSRDLFFIRPAQGLNDTFAAVVTDVRRTSESPKEVFERVANWIRQSTGPWRGQGILLLVCSDPPASLVEEVKQGQFYADRIPVGTLAYDLVYQKHWSSSGAPEWDFFDSQ